MPRIPVSILTLLTIQIKHLMDDGEKDLAMLVSAAVLAVEYGPELIDKISTLLIEGDQKEVESGEKEKSESKPLMERIQEALNNSGNYIKVSMIENTVVSMAQTADSSNAFAYRMATGLNPDGFKAIKVDNTKRDSPDEEIDTSIINEANEYWFDKKHDIPVNDEELVKFFKHRVKKTIEKYKLIAENNKNKIEGIKSETVSAIEKGEIPVIIPKKDLQNVINKAIEARDYFYSNSVHMGGSIYNHYYYHMDSFIVAMNQAKSMLKDYYPQIRNPNVSGATYLNDPWSLEISGGYTKFLYYCKDVYPTLKESMDSSKNMLNDLGPHVDENTFKYTGPIDNDAAVLLYCDMMLEACDVVEWLYQIRHFIRRLIIAIRIFINELLKGISLIVRAKKTASKVAENSAEYVSGTFQNVIVSGVPSTVTI